MTKFIYFMLPALPATAADREELAPIGHRSEKWQQMFDEIVELSQMADDYGFEAVQLFGEKVMPEFPASLRGSSPKPVAAGTIPAE